MKSTVDEIRQRFDADVERFSNLDTGQSATVDAPLAMALVAQAAAATTPHARHVLDVGCGAGNYTLKLLELVPNLNVTMLDLSRPMLDRATERVGRATAGTVTPIQGDIREITLPDGGFDIILAAAVLHHLRKNAEWRAVFTAFHRALRPGGSVWVFDLVESSIPAVQAHMWARYGEYLTGLKDEAYRDHVFAYVEKEDTPRPLVFQLDLLREVGFTQIEVLHKTVCFAAFGAVKGEPVSPGQAEASPTVVATAEDFGRLDIRAGRVVEVLPFPEGRYSTHILMIDFGPGIGVKKSLAKLAPNYAGPEVVGRLVMGVVNFPPRQIGKHRSEVLTLGVPDEQGNVVFVCPDTDVPVGGRLF